MNMQTENTNNSKKYDKILYYTNNTKITLIFVINVMTTLSALNPVTIQKLFNNRI